MSTCEDWQSLVKKIRKDAVLCARRALAREIIVGPYDGAGVEEPGKEKGPGYALFIGEWRIGWWKTRNEACEEGRKLHDAIVDHPVEIVAGDV